MRSAVFGIWFRFLIPRNVTTVRRFRSLTVAALWGGVFARGTSPRFIGLSYL